METLRPTLPAGHEPALPPAESVLSKRRWWFIGAGSVVALLLIMVLGYGPLLRYYVRHRAAAYGLELELDDASLGSGSVSLRGVTVRLEGVPVSVTAEHIDVALDGTAPLHVEAHRGVIAFEGGLAETLGSISRWSRDHKNFAMIPTTFDDLRVTCADGAGHLPWVTLSNATASFAERGKLTAKTTSLAGIGLGTFSATWPFAMSSLSIGVGAADPKDAPLRIDVHPTAESTSMHVALTPTALGELASHLGAGLPQKARVSGTADFKVPANGALTGSFAATIDGWVPPHDKEIDGIVHGNRTTAKASFQVGDDRTSVSLRDVELAAGALKLKGTGSLKRDGDHGLLHLDVHGPVACSEAAKSVANASGDWLSELMGRAAGSALEGSITVRVVVDADTHDLAHAKIDHSLKPNCTVHF